MRRSHSRRALCAWTLCLLTHSALAASPLAPTAEAWRGSIRHSLDFFDAHAWDEASGSYATNLAIDGTHKDETRHLIASARMVYGLYHGSKVDARYQGRAARQAAFVRRAFLRRDADGPYFAAAAQADGTVTDDPAVLAVNAQAYGIHALVAQYAVTRDASVLAEVEELHDALVRRFADPEHGGFFDGWDRASQEPVRTKSYNSTVYPATAYLLELFEVAPSLRAKLRPILEQLADAVTAHFVDPQTGWIVENFTADWQPDWRGWQAQEAGTIGVVGHNFQAAWMLMRVSRLPDLGADRARRCRAAARRILQSMLDKPVHDAARGGVGDVFVRETDEPMWHTNKPWWQQAEAILALDFARRAGVVRSREAAAVQAKATAFYFEHFIDREHGGEFDVVDAAGNPTGDTSKGTPGKSTYHTVELAREMLKNLGAW